MRPQSQIIDRLDKRESAERYRVSGDPRIAQNATHFRNRLAYEVDTDDLESLTDLPLNVRRAKISGWIDDLVDDEQRLFTDDEYGEIVDIIQADMVGLGPIQPLLLDETISEIMVNWVTDSPEEPEGYSKIYIERYGKIEAAPHQIRFRDREHLLHVIDRIVSPIGRRIDESVPYVDARLPSGHRVNAVISPLAVDGPILTIRKFKATPFTANEMLQAETLTPEMLTFLKACARARLNILISGGTGAGKTTTLNVLASYIPNSHRIITIEDAAELRFHDVHTHTLRLEARKPNVEGEGEVSIRDLLRNALRMRPDRIIVGECRGSEALDMLQAMNTGQEGSMTTVHANSTRDAFLRLENMVLSAEGGKQLSLRPIREQLSSAIDIVIQQSRLRGGRRKIVSISEVQGLRHDKIVLKDLFLFHQSGVDERGNAVGHFAPTGVTPKNLGRLRSRLTPREAEVLDGIFSPDYFSRELGPAVVHDSSISEIAINSPNDIYIERGGEMERLSNEAIQHAGGTGFHDATTIEEIVAKIAARVGRRLDEDIPMLDARLPDGSRVNVIMPPLVTERRSGTSPLSPVVTIRRFPTYYSLDDYLDTASLTRPMMQYLQACIRARYNMLIIGGTGSGKTTLLNAMCEAIPETQRVVTVEQVAELNLRQEHWVPLETRPADAFDERQVTIRDLVRNCLRMRPDRIIVGECRGEEALDMLQAMNTGHAGSMTTIHANSPNEAFVRLGTMTRMASEARFLESREINIQMNVIDVIVHTQRLHDGSRKVVSICEVEDGLALRPIFEFEATGFEPTEAGRRLAGVFAAKQLPQDMSLLQMHDATLSAEIFQSVAVRGGQLDET